MDAITPQTQRKKSKWSWLVIAIGIFALSFTCLLTLGSMYLDIAGEKTTGTLENAAKCDSGRSCFTAKITFTSEDGQEVSYYPLFQNSFLYEVDRQIRLESSTNTKGSDVGISYLKDFPRISKVTLSFHLEYIQKFIWAFWGLVILLIGWILSRDRAVTIDLRKRKQ